MTFDRQKPFWWEMAKVILVAAIAIAAFTGCAHTELRSATGKILFRTEADAAKVHYAGNGVVLDIDGMNHSVTNKIMGDNVRGGAQAVGAAVATSGILGFVR